MKARVLIMAMMLAFTSFANAQEQQKVENTPVEPQPNNKMELRVKRMTEKLLLDDAKAEKFAQLYQAYLEEKATCRPELVFGEELTDAQIVANIEAMINVREKAVEIDKRYYKKLSKLLNAKQLDMVFGPKAQFGKHPKAHGKGMHGMPPHHMGKPGAPKGKCPKEFKKGDCKKARGCKKVDGCKKDGKCVKADACPKADKCQKRETCKDGKVCNMKADCKKECKLDGKCVNGDACPKETNVEKATEE